jgi:hypothetical protein
MRPGPAATKGRHPAAPLENRPMTFTNETAQRLAQMAALAQRLADGERMTARQAAEALGFPPGFAWSDETVPTFCDLMDALGSVGFCANAGDAAMNQGVTRGDMPEDILDEAAANDSEWACWASADY